MKKERVRGMEDVSVDTIKCSEYRTKRQKRKKKVRNSGLKTES